MCSDVVGFLMLDVCVLIFDFDGWLASIGIFQTYPLFTSWKWVCVNSNQTNPTGAGQTLSSDDEKRKGCATFFSQ